MNPRYRDIVTALEEGRRALAKARLTAGLLRVVGIGLVTLAVLVLWASLQRALHLFSVPVAAAASVLGAGVLVFALVRWVVLPLVRMPGREAFVRLVEERFPEEKNLVVNAFELGDASRDTQAAQAPDLVDAIVARAAERIRGLDIAHWRNPAPDRPYLWAAGSALGAMLLLGILAPSLFFGALGQIVRPSQAGAPPVSFLVSPGNTEIDRGSDLAVSVQVDGTSHIPTLYFREHGGAWRVETFSPGKEKPAKRDSGSWLALLSRIDRPLEYRVSAPRAESPVYQVQVREVPRIAGYRAYLRYPGYTGHAPETVSAGTGDLAALLGTEVDLRVLVNRPVAGARLEWQAESSPNPTSVPLEAMDPTTWKTVFPIRGSATYQVVLLDDHGAERVRSPRYRVDAVPDRPPFLTLHFPQDDHDLASDMMERVVADAADDFGFSGVSIAYQVDDGPEKRVPYHPFTAGQTEFRLDTLWDLKGLDLMPGSTVAYYVEVRDNDAVSGPKAARSPVRRVRFPTVGEIYNDVAKEHDQEIEGLSGAKSTQSDLRQQLEKLDQELKSGRELNWDVRQDVQKSLDQQAALEKQVADLAQQLSQTLDKAANRGQMDQELVQKMSEINQMLENLSDEDTKRAFRELSRALDQMDRNALRQALDKVKTSQDEMLRGMDRTLELLKEIRREEQMANVVDRTDEIARLQEAIAKELDKLAGKGQTPEAMKQDQAQSGDSTGTPGAEKKDAGAEPDQKQGDASKQQQADASKQDQTGASQQKAGSQKDQADASQQDQDKDAKQGDASKQPPSDPSKKDQTDASKQESSSQESQQSAASQDQKSGSQEDQQSSKSRDQKQNQASLAELAQKQAAAQQMLEELKRVLRELQKLNQGQDMAQKLSDLEKHQTTQDLSKNMQGAKQGMSGGKPKEASPYAFKAREDAQQLAQMARSMQQNIQSNKDDEAAKALQRVIEGLIDVSGAQEDLSQSPQQDPRDLAERQLSLTDVAGSLADSLEAVMKQSFTLETPQLRNLHSAINRMGRAVRAFEEERDQSARHEAGESVSDLNETIVELMRSHEEMCGGQGSGQSLSQKMQGLSQDQQGVNRSTREMMEKLAQGQRLSYSDEERLAQMAAQQERIREGLEEAQRDAKDAKHLLGDMDSLTKEMEEAQKELAQRNVDRPLVERQQRILSRLLDAQRSMRQQEMSPERESKTATLAARPSPPPLPENLLQHNRSLAEDVLRGSSDRYPSQYRRLVEDYFRALSKENRTP
jgi:hypothetical protein